MNEGRAEALVFSGRPDPGWSVGVELFAALEKIWTALGEPTGSPATPPILGYRGCVVEAGGVRFEAFGGRVKREAADGEAERSDPQRRFERMVLGSAPPGTIPPMVSEALEQDR